MLFLQRGSSRDPGWAQHAGPGLLVWCEDGRCRAASSEIMCLSMVCSLVSPGESRAPSALWGGAGVQKCLFLQWHAHRDGIHPADSLSILLLPACRRSSSVSLLHSILQMYGLILQCLSLMRGVNGQVSLFLGKRGQGDKPLLVVLSFPQKMGMRLFSTPQGLQGVCSNVLPSGLNICQQPDSDWLLMVHCRGTRPLSWMGSALCGHCLPFALLG